MSKKLKTLIFISTLFVVVMIVGVLILSVVGNFSSVEVYDFRIYESPVFANDDETNMSTYSFYLSGNQSLTQEFMNDTDENGGRILYGFEVADESVATISETDGKYFITLKKVGQTEVIINRRVMTTSNNYIDNYFTTVKVLVYQELSICDVYLETSGSNRKPFVVEQTTVGGVAELSFVSSNPAVAKVVKENGNYFIEYYSEGQAIITVYCSGNSSIQDKVVVNVYNNLPNKLQFVDSNGNVIEQKTIYTDGKYYQINYELIAGSLSSNLAINGDNIRISSFSTSSIIVDSNATSDQFDSYNETPFDAQNSSSGAGIVLDKENKCIKIKKTDNNELLDSLAFISLQTYYVDAEGNEIVTGTYTIAVYVLKYRVIDLEFEVSNKPEFSDTEKNILNYHENLEWVGVNVNAVSNIYLSKSESVRTFYFKIWQVWNNGERTILSQGGVSTETANTTDYLGTSPNEDYYYFKSQSNDDGILISGSQTTLGIPFNISVYFIEVGAENLYYIDEDGYYNFNYFDERLRSITEVTNSSGKIIGLK